eukprot:jgi/Botrbrau1/13355/Bobra.0158s0009.1
MQSRMSLSITALVLVLSAANVLAQWPNPWRQATIRVADADHVTSMGIVDELPSGGSLIQDVQVEDEDNTYIPVTLEDMARNGINVTGLPQLNDPKEAGKPHNVDGDKEGETDGEAKDGDREKEGEKDGEGQDDEKEGKTDPDRDREGTDGEKDRDEAEVGKNHMQNTTRSDGDSNSYSRPETQSSTSYSVRRLLHLQ